MDPRNALYNQVKPMITKTAWDLCRTYPNLDYGDALGECNMQWAKGIDRFDPERASLSTFTHYQLRAAKKNVHEKAHTKIEKIMVVQPCGEHSGDADHPAESTGYYENIAFVDPSRNLADGLDSDEQEVLLALFHGTHDNMTATGADVHRAFSARGWTRRRAYAVLDSMRAKVTDNLVGV